MKYKSHEHTWESLYVMTMPSKEIKKVEKMKLANYIVCNSSLSYRPSPALSMLQAETLKDQAVGPGDEAMH